MPLLIHIKLLLALKFPTESTAACTVVKLQHPLWSTQIIDVLLGSIVGKFGANWSQGDCLVLSSSVSWRWWSWWWWWWRLTVNNDKAVEHRSRKQLKYVRGGWVDAKTAKIAIKIGKYMALGFIFLDGTINK